MKKYYAAFMVGINLYVIRFRMDDDVAYDPDHHGFEKPGTLNGWRHAAEIVHKAAFDEIRGPGRHIDAVVILSHDQFKLARSNGVKRWVPLCETVSI